MTTQQNNDDFKAFALVLRAALLMVVRWIEKRYSLKGAGDCETHTPPVPFVQATNTIVANGVKRA